MKTLGLLPLWAILPPHALGGSRSKSTFRARFSQDCVVWPAAVQYRRCSCSISKLYLVPAKDRKYTASSLHLEVSSDLPRHHVPTYYIST